MPKPMLLRSPLRCGARLFHSSSTKGNLGGPLARSYPHPKRTPLPGLRVGGVGP